MSELIDPPFGTKNPCEPLRITDGYDFVVINGVRYAREGKKIPGPATKAMLEIARVFAGIEGAIDISAVAMGDIKMRCSAFIAEWES